MVFREIVTGMQEFGIYSTVIPFLLAFTLTYAILEKTKIFAKKKLNITVALIFGLLTTSSMAISTAMNTFLEKVGFSLMIVLAIILVLGLLKVDFNKFQYGKYIGLVLFLFILYFQFASTTIATTIQNFVLNRYFLVIAGAVFTIWWITGFPSAALPVPEKRPKKERSLETTASDLEKKYGKGKLEEEKRLSREDLKELFEKTQEGHSH